MKTLIQTHTPQECENIASGQQTIKVGKVLPKRYVNDINDFEPYNVLIYCTKGKPIFDIPRKYYDCEQSPYWGITEANGKVIGEYVVDRIYFIKNTGNFRINNDNGLAETIAKQTCMYYSDMKNYLGEKNGYAFHISQLKIYDEPKELTKFRKAKDCENCMSTKKFGYCMDLECAGKIEPITHAPKPIIYCTEV